MIETINTASLLTQVRQRQFFYLALFLVLVSVVVILLVFWPQVQAIFGMIAKIKAEQKINISLEKKEIQLANLSSSAELIKIDQVNQILPAKKPLVEMLSAVNLVAAETRVVITGIELSPGKLATASGSTSAPAPASSTQKGRDYGTIEVALVVSGSLNQINQFLSQVEKIAPMTTVTNMSLNKISKPRTLDASLSANLVSENFEAKLTLVSYFFTKSVNASLEAALPELSAKENQLLTSLQDFRDPNQNRQLQLQPSSKTDLFSL